MYFAFSILGQRLSTRNTMNKSGRTGSEALLAIIPLITNMVAASVQKIGIFEENHSRSQVKFTKVL